MNLKPSHEGFIVFILENLKIKITIDLINSDYGDVL